MSIECAANVVSQMVSQHFLTVVIAREAIQKARQVPADGPRLLCSVFSPTRRQILFSTNKSVSAWERDDELKSRTKNRSIKNRPRTPRNCPDAAPMRRFRSQPMPGEQRASKLCENWSDRSDSPGSAGRQGTGEPIRNSPRQRANPRAAERPPQRGGRLNPQLIGALLLPTLTPCPKP